MLGFLLKLLAAAAGMGFGAMGLGRETRDKTTGRLNRNGKIALWGIVVAFVIGIASTVYDFVSDEQKSARNQADAQKLLVSVRRGIYPFRNITADLVLTLNRNFPGVEDVLKHYPEDEILRGLDFRAGKTSPPFSSESLFFKALRNQNIDVYILQRVPPKGGKQRITVCAGRFF
jgi:hypothetical protein